MENQYEEESNENYARGPGGYSQLLTITRFSGSTNQLKVAREINHVKQ